MDEKYQVQSKIFEAAKMHRRVQRTQYVRIVQDDHSAGYGNPINEPNSFPFF